jgi:hypothetical protein
LWDPGTTNRHESAYNALRIGVIINRMTREYLRVPLYLTVNERSVASQTRRITYTVGFPNIKGASLLILSSIATDIITMPSQSKIMGYWVDEKIKEF